MDRDETRDEPTRIDVELVESVAHARPPVSPEGIASASGGPDDAPGRRAGVALAVAAAIVSGVLGLAVGRATTGGGETADGGDSTSTVARTEVADERIAPVGPVEEPAEPRAGPQGDREDEPSPDRVASDGSVVTEFGTLEPPPVEVSTIRLDPRVAGIDLQLVAPRRDGTWVRLDLVEGALEEFPERRPASLAFRDGALVAGEGWFTYVPLQGSGDLVVWRDSTQSWDIVSLGSTVQVLREPGTDRFWVAEAGDVGLDPTLRLVDVDGEPVGERIELPAGAFATSSDPSGGLVVWAGDRLYSVTPDEQVPIVDGQLLALDERTAVAWACDDAFRCGIDVIDRSTGERRRVDAADSTDEGRPAVERLLTGGFFGVADLARPLAPDGGALATTTFSPTSSELVVLDLATGELAVVDGAAGPFPLVWTPDSRYLIYVDGGVPLAFDRETGDVFAISADGELTGWIDLVAVT